MPNREARRLRRSLLFVPGGEPRKIEKARDTGADALILDLEDAVAPEEKDRAREVVAAALREGGFGESEPMVRINAPGTPQFEADLEAVVAAGARALMVPKAETAEGLARVAARLDGLDGKPGTGETGRVRLLALVESAAGIAGIASLPGASPRLDALCFGHADFSRDMGLAAAMRPRADPRRRVGHRRPGGRWRPSTRSFSMCATSGPSGGCGAGMRLGFELASTRRVRIVNDLLTPTPSRSITRA
jgi:citrate lyase beta subunit